MALAGVGTSFAMWTQTLNSIETVHVATFGIAWSPGNVVTSGDNQGIVYGEEYIDANGNLVVTINNAYPCVDIYIPYDVHLTGQVWATLYEIQFTCDGTFDPAWIVGHSPTDGVLVTPNAIYYGWIRVHLGENAVPGVTYSFTNSLQCHQYNEGTPPIGGKTLLLPPNVVTATYHYPGLSSYWRTTLSNVPVGYNVGNGAYLGWCVDQDTYIVNDVAYTINLMTSYDVNNPWHGNHYPATYDWPCANYIINHKATGATIDQIQNAIWYFIDHGYTGSDTVVWGMINDALLNGKNFVPGTGQWMAVLCIGNPEYQNGYHVQHTFIEVDP